MSALSTHKSALRAIRKHVLRDRFCCPVIRPCIGGVILNAALYK